ncbi:hypothetical protein HGP16_21325 [Rhizobium sp. P40RR-XXII]|uniref:hypothetical protein n=1 Tax=unclassified Rhizobium TaxID=2613769 RepID=UPI001456D057|nr:MULTISPECIES: hypothetical protein [unclassified Rhizobium]NLR89195.1 hypothetical protein [Rhizobium sp. P28RR-XV]NLS19083.1 hypothetical protein [Rhizobium sp. P40RR-XXII]
MDATRESLSLLSLRLEQLLQHHGIPDGHDQMEIARAGELPAELQHRLSSLLENMAELKGLIEAGRDARRGKSLSPAVMNAAHIMMEEVCRALEDRKVKQ